MSTVIWVDGDIDSPSREAAVVAINRVLVPNGCELDSGEVRQLESSTYCLIRESNPVPNTLLAPYLRNNGSG